MVRGLRVIAVSLFITAIITCTATAQQNPPGSNPGGGQEQQLRKDMQNLRQQLEPLRSQMQQLMSQVKTLRDQMRPILKKLKADRDQLRALHGEHGTN